MSAESAPPTPDTTPDRAALTRARNTRRRRRNRKKAKAAERERAAQKVASFPADQNGGE